jgi:hypothetical protein
MRFDEGSESQVARPVHSVLFLEGAAAPAGEVTEVASEAFIGLHRERSSDGLCLRADRLADGRRTFRVVPGEPLATSHGRDLYDRIAGEATAAPSPAPVIPVLAGGRHGE